MGPAIPQQVVPGHKAAKLIGEKYAEIDIKQSLGILGEGSRHLFFLPSYLLALIKLNGTLGR